MDYIGNWNDANFDGKITAWNNNQDGWRIVAAFMNASDNAKLILARCVEGGS